MADAHTPQGSWRLLSDLPHSLSAPYSSSTPVLIATWGPPPSRGPHSCPEWPPCQLAPASSVCQRSPTRSTLTPASCHRHACFLAHCAGFPQSLITSWQTGWSTCSFTGHLHVTERKQAPWRAGSVIYSNLLCLLRSVTAADTRQTPDTCLWISQYLKVAMGSLELSGEQLLWITENLSQWT